MSQKPRDEVGHRGITGPGGDGQRLERVARNDQQGDLGFLAKLRDGEFLQQDFPDRGRGIPVAVLFPSLFRLCSSIHQDLDRGQRPFRRFALHRQTDQSLLVDHFVDIRAGFQEQGDSGGFAICTSSCQQGAMAIRIRSIFEKKFDRVPILILQCNAQEHRIRHSESGIAEHLDHLQRPLHVSIHGIGQSLANFRAFEIRIRAVSQKKLHEFQINRPDHRDRFQRRGIHQTPAHQIIG